MHSCFFFNYSRHELYRRIIDVIYTRTEFFCTFYIRACDTEKIEISHRHLWSMIGSCIIHRPRHSAHVTICVSYYKKHVLWNDQDISPIAFIVLYILSHVWCFAVSSFTGTLSRKPVIK